MVTAETADDRDETAAGEDRDPERRGHREQADHEDCGGGQREEGKCGRDQEQGAEPDGNDRGKEGGENQEESFHASKTRRSREKLQGLHYRPARTVSVAP